MPLADFVGSGVVVIVRDARALLNELKHFPHDPQLQYVITPVFGGMTPVPFLHFGLLGLGDLELGAKSGSTGTEIGGAAGLGAEIATRGPCRAYVRRMKQREEGPLQNLAVVL